jgi:hypothetical protein
METIIKFTIQLNLKEIISHFFYCSKSYNMMIAFLLILFYDLLNNTLDLLNEENIVLVNP